MKSPHIKELFDLSGKVALVTGGARNLGYDMALALAEAGADVGITSRTFDNARESSERIAKETGKRVMGFECDVRDESNVGSMVDAVLKEFAHIDTGLAHWDNQVVIAGGEDRPSHRCAHVMAGQFPKEGR